jgi:uncharacterized membrane protein
MDGPNPPEWNYEAWQVAVRELLGIVVWGSIYVFDDSHFDHFWFMWLYAIENSLGISFLFLTSFSSIKFLLCKFRIMKLKCKHFCQKKKVLNS